MATPKTYVGVLGCMLLLLLTDSAYAVKTHTKLWTAGLQTGPLSKNKKVRYYLEEDFRLIDDKYKYEQTIVWAGLGYRTTPTITLYGGVAPVVSRNLSGVYIHENILWQQLSWAPEPTTSIKFVSRSRLEETKRLHESEWSLLLRQLQLVRIPFNQWPGHALILSDSVFFNLKHPAWLNNNSFISQNRAFIGIETQLTKHSTCTAGYMNQFQFTNPNQLSNILVITFNLVT